MVENLPSSGGKPASRSGGTDRPRHWKHSSKTIKRVIVEVWEVCITDCDRKAGLTA